MAEIFNYEILRIIWWVLLGVLLIGFAIMDGFDLGVGTLLPFVAKNDHEKRVVINSVGPVWEGNQVWFILGGGAIFAAWPFVYAVAFSGFYFAMLLVLLALILRPVGFDYRSKINNSKWRNVFDSFLFISGAVPSLVFGVAIGNVLQGVAFSLDDYMVIQNKIGFWSLFTPFSLLCGVLSLLMLTSHGASYLALKTDDGIQRRVIKINKFLPLANIVLFAFGGYHLGFIDGYKVASDINFGLDSNPLLKSVFTGKGLWYQNYEKYSWIVIAPALGFIGFFATFIANKKSKFGLAFIASSIAILGVISTVGLTMFPFILPSSLDPSSSLMVFDASSSYRTLVVMLVAAVIFVPIILAYTSWVYHVMRGKVTVENIKNNDKNLY